MTIEEARKKIAQLEAEKRELILLNEILVEATDKYSCAVNNLLRFLKTKN